MSPPAFLDWAQAVSKRRLTVWVSVTPCTNGLVDRFLPLFRGICLLYGGIWRLVAAGGGKWVGQRRQSGGHGLRCKEAGVRPSMGSVGDAYDNTMCESFFATLECELLERRKFQTKAEARMAIFQFIEGWYNPGRRHSALGYMSPINYERSANGRMESVSP